MTAVLPVVPFAPILRYLRSIFTSDFSQRVEHVEQAHKDISEDTKQIHARIDPLRDLLTDMERVFKGRSKKGRNDQL